MSSTSNLFKRMALGAAGGFAGTLAIQALMAASKKWLPAALPPLREDPGQFMVEKAEEALPADVRSEIPDAAESVAAQTLAAGYGLTFGALYGLLRPEGGSSLMDGLLVGLACWATGYLGWLPATGLMPPVWRQKPIQVAGPAVDHLAYGLITVAVYDWLRRRV